MGVGIMFDCVLQPRCISSGKLGLDSSIPVTWRSDMEVNFHLFSLLHQF